MTKKVLGYVHLEWTCPRCETKNPGSQKFCNGCGGPQPEDIEFEQPAQEKLIEDEAEIARAKAGPDVHCPYCNARNSGDAKFCGACGGDLSGAQARESGRVIGAHRTGPVEDINCPACGTPNPATAHRCVSCGASLVAEKVEPPKPRPQEKTGAGRRSLFSGVAIGAILLCVVVVAAVIFLLLRTEEMLGVVQGITWARTIAIEAMGPVEHEDWLDDIPGDAELGSCSQEHRYTQDEPAFNSTEVCGTPYTVDTGTGHGEVVQDCVYDVYEDWCTYTQQEWMVVDEVTVSGSDLNPYWPDTSLETGQRQGESSEEYKVRFQTSAGDYYYTTTDFAQFSQFHISSEWVLNVNQLNAVVSVEPAN